MAQPSTQHTNNPLFAGSTFLLPSVNERVPCTVFSKGAYKVASEENFLCALRLTAVDRLQQTACTGIEIHMACNPMKYESLKVGSKRQKREGDRAYSMVVHWEDVSEAAKYASGRNVILHSLNFHHLLTENSLELSRWSKHPPTTHPHYDNRNQVAAGDYRRSASEKEKRVRVSTAFVVTIEVEPVCPDSYDECHSRLKALEEYGRREPGCIMLDVYQGLEVDNQEMFLLYGFFDSQTSFREFQNSRSYSLLLQVGVIKTSPPSPKSRVKDMEWYHFGDFLTLPPVDSMEALTKIYSRNQKRKESHAAATLSDSLSLMEETNSTCSWL